MKVWIAEENLLGQCAPSIAPAAMGWIEFAYRKIGSPARVTEKNWERGLERTDPLVFEIACS